MEQTTPEQTESTPAVAPANLSIQDLLLVVQTLQIVTQRGAFRAEEMSNIGGLYDRLIAFLTASGAIKPAEAPVADPQGE